MSSCVMKDEVLVGTVQSSCTGCGRSVGQGIIRAKEIEQSTHEYESLLYQHNAKPLLHAALADNNYYRYCRRRNEEKSRRSSTVTEKQENKVLPPASANCHPRYRLKISIQQEIKKIK